MKSNACKSEQVKCSFFVLKFGSKDVNKKKEQKEIKRQGGINS